METTIKVWFEAKQTSLVTLPQSAAIQLKAEDRQGRDIPPEEGGKALEHLPDLELVCQRAKLT